jgi:hypothetical protein
LDGTAEERELARVQNGLGGGVYVDPSASATADLQTMIAGNQASMSDNDVWGTITIGR